MKYAPRPLPNVPIVTKDGLQEQHFADWLQQADRLLRSSAGLIIGYVKDIDFNPGGATDTAIDIVCPTSRYRLLAVEIVNTGTTASLNVARAGVFSATGGGGTTVAADQALAALSSNLVNVAGSLMSMAPTVVHLNFTRLYFRIGTPQGAAAKGDVFLRATPLQ